MPNQTFYIFHKLIFLEPQTIPGYWFHDSVYQTAHTSESLALNNI